jgi:hypothetical protein
MIGYARKDRVPGRVLMRGSAKRITGSASVYALPKRIEPAYGRSPKSFTLFAKLSLGD